MFKSSIFQKNIAVSSPESEIALSFENCQIDISDRHLKISKNGNSLLNTELTFQEKDFSTITYLGKFGTGVSFRVIRPTDLSLANLKSRFQCESAFSIASVSPSGYAIHFILTSEGQNPNIGNVVEKGKKEQIQRLIDGSTMALQANLHSNFIDFTKRILGLISTTNELSEYNQADEIIAVMKGNRHIYTERENQKIK
ncbi:MAG: hypothetical protein KDC52_17465 [Ignavibacteriae bacterium]|nr:hypothetical protein [Ignavibacteriota bacterium]MCB0753264.1 hypothetical protein [Ignavibacteriota bacterium]